MQRPVHLVRSASAFFAVVWPPLGVTSIVVLSLMRRPQVPTGFFRMWLLAWGPLLALGVAHALAEGGGREAWQWAGVAIVLGWFLIGSRAARFVPLALGLVVTVMALAAERAVATTTWHPTRQDDVRFERYLAALGGQELRGAGTFERVWQGSEVAGPTLITLELRQLAGRAGWTWYPYDPAFAQEPLQGGPAGYARITTPPSGGSYVTRRADTGAPLAGRTFRARLRLRASNPFDVEASSCRGVLLREVGGSGEVACFATTIGTDWSEHEVTWQVPAGATSEVIRIELRIGTRWFDVGDVHLEEATAEGWRSLGALQPAGVLLSAAVPSTPRVDWITHVVVPTPDWQRVALRLEDARLVPTDDLRLVLDVEDGAVIEIRNTSAARLAAAEVGQVRLTPSPRPQRGHVWFGHPNLAGHSLAVAGLLTTALAPTLLTAIAATTMTLGGVALTGSRAAWLVAIVGLLTLAAEAWRREPAHANRRRGNFITFLIVLFAAAMLIGVSLRGSTPSTIQLLGRGASNEVTRSEVMMFAWRTMLAHPLTGIGDGGFRERWLAAHPDDARKAPPHGHNLWLHVGATFGLPGFVVTLWLTSVLLWISSRWAGRRGLVVVIAAFALQFVDATFTFAGVYAPLFLALGSFSATHSDPPA